MRVKFQIAIAALLACLPAACGASDTDKEKNKQIEDDFIATVQDFAAKENNKHTLSDRKDALSKALNGFDVHGWTGVVKELDKSENGDYTVALTVGDTIVLRSGSALPDYDNARTVIKADSAICVVLNRLHVGQKVLFDGTFMKDKDKGPNKGGLAGSHTVQQTEFAFHLAKIRGQKPPPEKTWEQIVAGAREQILAAHNAGGGKISLYEFAHSMKFKMKGETETMVKDRGDLVFKPTGEHSGEFTNEGPPLDIKCKIGHIEIPKLVSGTYTCEADRTVLRFSKNHTFVGKVAVIVAPLESITADEQNVAVKIGGIMGGALSRTLPIKE